MESAPQTLEEAIRQIEARDRRIQELERLIAKLEQRVEELQRGQKRQAAPFSKGKPKSDPQPPGRKPGDEYGVKAHRQPPPHWDERYEVALPDCCPECGGMVQSLGKSSPQFQTEIPRRPIVRRFDVALGICGDCGLAVQGRHPLQTSDALGAAASQLGPEAQATAVILNKQMGLSHGKIAEFFRIAFGIKVSRGGIAQVVLRAAARCAGAYQEIEVSVRQAPMVVPDETGWRIGGALAWLWVFVTEAVTLYRIARSRGFEVAAEVLGADFAGDLVHDGWAPYDQFRRAGHQQCDGHLLRRCEDLLATARAGAARFPHAVKRLLQRGLELRDQRDAGVLSDSKLAKHRLQLEGEIDVVLLGTIRHEPNRRFADHLFAHRDQLFHYLDRPGVDATNWRAEQAIRPAVVNRKVWGGNRTPRGAEAQALLMSVLRTCGQAGRSALEFLARTFRTPRGQPPPELLTPQFCSLRP